MNPKRDSNIGVARRLRAAREQAGLSQGQVARMLKVHRPTISQIEAGRRKVTAAELVRFSDIYDVSISWLSMNKPEVPDARLELAARELARLNAKDLDTILVLLRSLKASRRSK